MSQAKPGFDALPAVVQELNGVIRDVDDGPSHGVLEGKRYLDGRFTTQRFLNLIEGRQPYPVLHIATHFKLADEGEDQSYLLLGDGERLSLRQIRTDQGILLRNYDLVTLSACETAVASGRKGREVESLGVILQRKGAKSIIATLWKVQDEGTARFMTDFYRSRGEERRMTKAEALRQTQVAFLEGRVKSANTKIDLKHPYYWAPFVLMGNWL